MANAVAALVMLLAGYAHVALARFVVTPQRLWGLRMLLAGLGVAVGGMGAWLGMLDGASAATLFFMGFGLVHFPAAMVLFLKARRGEGKT
jgi:hypothetical protein